MKKNELTLTQAATELGVTRQSVFIAIKRGRLRAASREMSPFGSVLFIRRSDFETWKSESQVRRAGQQTKGTR
jgi:Helix-turn-helix domain